MGKNNIWLAGPAVCGDWDLIRVLTPGHVVTLVESFDPARLAREAAFRTASQLVVDCGGLHDPPARALDAIQALKKKYPGLVVLLVDGNLGQEEVIEAFRRGVRDFFPSPYDARLLGERILELCRRGSSRGPGAGP